MAKRGDYLRLFASSSQAGAGTVISVSLDTTGGTETGIFSAFPSGARTSGTAQVLSGRALDKQGAGE
jgi:hypothetical protein